MKQKISIIGILIVMLIFCSTLLSIGNESYAANSSYWLGLTNVRKDGSAYEIQPNGEAKKIWKVVSYSSKDDTNINYSNAFYCLRAELGFGLSNGNQDVTKEKRQYNVKHDMKTEKTTALEKLKKINGMSNIDETTYNKILWLLDNMYIKGTEGAEEYKKQLLLTCDIISDSEEPSDAYIQDEDIEVVQQLALWYFTNNDSNNYNKIFLFRHKIYSLSFNETNIKRRR